MTAIHSVGPRATATDNESLLQHSYFIALVAIVFALVIIRILVLRWRKQALSEFFRIGGASQYTYGSHPPNDSNHGSMYHGLQLAPLPAAYHPDRRVRATDIDARGRRLNPTGESWHGKDALPAYDNLDRPPKYFEVGWTHGEPSLPTEQFTLTPSPEGGQSGMAHLNTADGAPVDRVNPPLYHTHTVAGINPGTEALPPPIHHDLSNA